MVPIMVLSAGLAEFRRWAITGLLEFILTTTPSSSSSTTSSSSDIPRATFDLSLAPEPPPQKARVTAPSSDIHSRKYLKQSGAEVEPSGRSDVVGRGMGSSKMLEQHNNDKSVNSLSVMTSSISSSSTTAATTSTVYSSSIYSSTCTSKKELLAARLVQSGAQDTSQENKNFSNEGNVKMTAKGSVRRTGLSGVGRGGSDEDWLDATAYFGETMVRKSTLPSGGRSSEISERLGQNRQPSVSTPSSPTLNDYQRHYGKKLSSSSTSTTASDVSKYMSSPGRYSMGDRPYPLKREKTSGFLNIFRWFRNRDKKKRSTSVDRMSNASGGSVNSLSSSTSGFSYVPIMRSKSADTQNKMIASKNQNQPKFGITRRYKLFQRDSSLGRTNSSTSNEEGGRRLSAVSASSDTSSKPESRGATMSRKKRPAPQPPGSPKMSDTGSLRSQKSCTSLPARELRPSITSEQSSPSSISQIPEGRRLQKSKSEGVICAKAKRRAPLPPVQTTGGSNTLNSNKENLSPLTNDGQKKRQAPNVPAEKKDRPLSTVSTGSYLSQSPSSASTTLKSQSSSGATSSQYSAESIRLESGFLRQDITKSSSSPAIPDTSKLTLSPRPWYKRKKNRDKENSKDSKATSKKDKVYDSWMPDIQFSRSKLSLSGTFRKSKSFEYGDENTQKKSKDDDKKEKRKSQVSLLANISELDRAATEQMQRELEQRKAQKKTYDNKFYKTSEPHILTQTDFLPRTKDRGRVENFDMNTVSSSGTATLGSSTSDRIEVGEHGLPNSQNGIYDNLSDSGLDLTLPQSYSKHATLRIEEKEGNFRHSIGGKLIASDALQFGLSESHKGSNSPKTKRVTSNLTQPSQASPESSPPPTRESPMRRAAFDAELFYQLAKDTHTTAEPRSKNSPVLVGVRETRKMPSYEEVSEEELDDDPIVVPSDSPGHFCRPNKNFGLRMNNFFSPDVSTIIEASESMTSSATTPADDIYEDLPVPSSINGRRRESVHDEANSEANYEFRLNSTNAREIMQELADVRHEIQKINEEEEEAAKNREQRKSDKIREEVLSLRERSNFEVWQNAIGQTGTSNMDVAPPPPIELNEGVERKLKWVCEVCTLINLPWRLQCEACMKRRPLHPKRVDEDNKSFTSEYVSSQPSISDESPVTVIHDESNAEGAREAVGGAEAAVPDTGQLPDNDQKSHHDKKKKDINWERELQKYFRTFDEHAKGINDTKDLSAASSETKKSTTVNVSETEERYRKLKKSSRNESMVMPACISKEAEVRGKGAKPKTTFFGTAQGPPDTFIHNPDSERENESKTLEFTVKKSHSNEGLNKEPDMDQLRRARLAKFEGSGCDEDEQLTQDEVMPSAVKNEKNCKKKCGDRKKKNKKIKTELEEGSKEGPGRNQDESSQRDQHLMPEESDHQDQEEDKTFYHKNYRKPQVLKPSGAVRNVVSIFNQFEQLQQAKKEKPQVTRRRSFGNVVGRTQIFEQLNSETNSPELPRSNRECRECLRPQPRSDVPRDTEVFSAVAKFDEMAAMAELDKIEKQRMRKEAARRKPRLSAISRSNSLQISIDSATTTAASIRQPMNGVNHLNHTPTTQPYPQHNGNREQLHGKPSFDSKSNSHPTDLSEGIIKGGVLYTEQRKRSMSIGSGTFELIQAKDFETIEAQHSECSPTAESRSITSPATPSPITETTSITSPANPPAGAVVPQIIIEPHEDHISPSSHSDNSTPLVSEVGVKCVGRGQMEKKEVERLSRQLTEADGIATFKATLRVEEPTLGQVNTLSINRLLKRLEGSIACGNHAEAARLAHELAELRVSCSVTRNPKTKIDDEVTMLTSSLLPATSLVPSESEHILPDTNPNIDLNGTRTPTSNMSECFYDASEMLDHEDININEPEAQLDLDDIDIIEHNVDKVQLPDTDISNDLSSNATETPSIGYLSPTPLQTSASADSINDTQIGSATGEIQTTGDVQEEIITRRDTRVDPARREVKSDTISKLPDGPPVYMKDLSEALLPFNVKMYVEDKNSHQGPITFTVMASMTVGELRKKVCQDFGFPPEVQRWILGRRLADDDNHTLEHHKVTTEGCPIFLYLVAPDSQPKVQAQKPSIRAAAVNGVDAPGSHYSQAKTNHTLEHHKVTTEGCPIFLYLVAPDSQPKVQAQKPSIRAAAVNGVDAPGSHYSQAKTESGLARYLQVSDEEGNIEYKFYNPETKIYEISVDMDDSDYSEEDDDDDDDDDVNSDDEDTLEEEDENMYQNVNINKRDKEENPQLAYSAVATKKTDLQESETKAHQSTSPQLQDGKYSLPQPLSVSHVASTATNVSSQTNDINIHSKAMSTSQTNNNSATESQSACDQSNVQKHNQTQPLERQVSSSTPSSRQQQQLPQKQRKQSHDITIPNGQQQQQVKATNQFQPHQKQQQSSTHHLAITPKSQQDSVSIQDEQQHAQNPSLNQCSSKQLHLPKPAQTLLNKSQQPQSRQDLPQQQSPHLISGQPRTTPTQTTLSSQTQGTPMQTPILSNHIQETPTQTHNQSPQPKHLSKWQQQISTSQHNVKQPLQNHSTQSSEEHQLSQSSQHKSSQSSQHQSSHSLQPQSPQTLHHSSQSQHEVGQLKHQTRSSPPQQQRQTKNKDPSSPQLRNKETGKPQSPEQQVDVTTELPSPTKVHGWVCPRCTLVNVWTRPGCEACATERPGTMHAQATGTSDKGSGLGAVVSALERQGYVPNPDQFECRVCFLDVGVSEGVVLRDCLHTFCRDCLASAVKYSDTADVKCPYRDNQYSCDSSLQDREIKALVTPQEYDKHLTKSVKQAEGTMQNVFHCKTPDCPGFCQFEDNVNSFHCDVCEKVNCLTCQDMIRRGDGLPCPKCSVMLMRKWGCDWMRCPMCRTEICWVTRGPRWGPGGPGDVSGGCKCGIRGQKCHPKCTYCH
ncbi:RanBP-type and C3HC4-type zinc finger-containing protein 1-like [Homarus americanus]|uniref:RanBP-type and C3HC4-type zinc finger-containing protein 1 n=1 Tax=Homarus americanus TaxID=6706 RepID=A0A8J5T0R6_HOMAM|nr:RanBP-type and C3HC4-type zinc finger-containing protein 1-like [Homarus americanus]